jgi:hypothetical protein
MKESPFQLRALFGFDKSIQVELNFGLDVQSHQQKFLAIIPLLIGKGQLLTGAALASNYIRI